MKKYICMLGAALVLSLAALAAAGPVGAATRYYTPVVSAAGDKIAYVKRDYRVWASGGGLIPFMGGKPYRERVLSDRIQVCVKDLKTGRVKVVGDWKPKPVKKSGLISIAPVLNWELEALRYVIRLRTDKDPGVGTFRRPYAYLTNVEKRGGLKTGPTAAGTVRVRLENKSGGRHSRGSAVVVDRTWDRETALPLIRRKLDRVIETHNDPAQRDRVHNLAKFVAGQATPQLPDRIVALFLDESKRPSRNYPDLTPVVVATGEAAVEPLLQQYGSSPPGTRLAILTIFGEIGSATALTLVRREIRAGNRDLQNAAVVALRKIKGDRAGEELVLLLGDTRLSAPVRVTVLGQLTQVTGADWPVHVLDTALQDPAVFTQLGDVVADLDRFPEREIWFRLEKIYPYLESEDPRTVRTAQRLIARIRFWNHLSKLEPVVEDLIKARYDYGLTTDASGNLIDTGSGPMDKRVVWDRDLAIDMLDHIGKELRDPVMWLPRNVKYPENLLTLLYLEDLYQKRKGRQIINRPPVEAQLEISVRDAAGTLQAAGRRFVVLERPVTLQGEPVVPGFPPPTCAGRLFIDKEKWRLTFNPLVMRLADRTLTKPVSIPFGGACEINMASGPDGQTRLLTWTLRHIDAPRPRPKRNSKAVPSGHKRYGDRKGATAP